MTSLPDDLKADIARVARSLEPPKGLGGGMCMWRTIAGYGALNIAGIEARASLGGLLYRVGADDRRDVIAFVGPENVGQKTSTGFAAHYFLRTDAGEIVDFAVGDWKDTLDRIPNIDGPNKLGPVQWAINPPDFHWDDARKFQRPAKSNVTTLEIGEAWYTGFRGDTSDIIKTFEYVFEVNRTILASALVPELKAINARERVAAASKPLKRNKRRGDRHERT